MRNAVESTVHSLRQRRIRLRRRQSTDKSLATLWTMDHGRWTCFWFCVFSLWFCAHTGPTWGEASEQVSAEAQPDWPTVIAQLRQQLDQMPGQATTRKQLAIAYNNYAVSLADQGRLIEATQQLQEAIRIDPSNSQFHTNLVRLELQAAQLAYQAYQREQAKEAIHRALAVDPNSADAYVLLGEIEYHSQRLKEAKAAWQTALAIDPSLTEVRKKLEQLNQELPVESKFERLSQVYFDIRYTEALERPAGFDIRDALLQARRSIGGDVAFWPKHKLVVLIYSAEQFRRLRQDTPDWVAGQYDGKIRLPLPGQDLDRDAVTRILFHEYTHAIIHELTKGQLPTWLNEGLAEYEAWKQRDPPWRTLRQAFAEERVIPWANLSAQFSSSLPAQEVALAYEQSHSIAHYLVERYGFWRLRRVLQAVAAGTSLEDALTKELHIKLTRLESDWRKWLEGRLATQPF